MCKRLVALLVIVLMLGACVSAYAVTGPGGDCADGVEFSETGYATFILDNNGKICGALKPCEELKKLGFQHYKNCSPRGLEDGKALRRRAFAKVVLDDGYYVEKGGTELEVTIILTDVDLVEEVVGDLSVESIIDATIYAPCLTSGTTYATHMFLPANSGRQRVGTVIFASGKCLALYVGNFDCDCDLELGFTAVAVKPQPEPEGCIEPPDHCGPCVPLCTPCTPPVTVTTTTEVTTVTTTTSTTTTTIGGGSCNPCPPCSPCGH